MKNQPSKNRTLRNTLLVLLCLIAISNTPPVQFFTLEGYHYRNADNSFSYTEYPGKGLDFETGQTRWERFKKLNRQNPNKTLYRTFRINPLKFWEWWQFIAHPGRYRLPYQTVQKT